MFILKQYQAALDEKKFSHRILMEYEELAQEYGKRASERTTKDFLPSRRLLSGQEGEYNQEAIDACRKNSVGWLCLRQMMSKTRWRHLKITDEG